MPALRARAAGHPGQLGHGRLVNLNDDNEVTLDRPASLCFTAEVPGQIRGPQFHYSWADELAAWDLRPDDSGANAWDNLQFATRLGRKQGIKSQILFTTTPVPAWDPAVQTGNPNVPGSGVA
mgnify:CR=1 FL=1